MFKEIVKTFNSSHCVNRDGNLEIDGSCIIEGAHQEIICEFEVDEVDDLTIAVAESYTLAFMIEDYYVGENKRENHKKRRCVLCRRIQSKSV